MKHVSPRFCVQIKNVIRARRCRLTSQTKKTVEYASYNITPLFCNSHLKFAISLRHQSDDLPDFAKKEKDPMALLRQADIRSNTWAGNSKAQMRMFTLLERMLPPDTLILLNHIHPECKFADSKRKMELDIYVPSLNLALEYHGTQHYYWSHFYGSAELTELRDEEKRQACKNIGITLVEIPFWWDRLDGSLRATIHSLRPDIIADPGKGTPIPKEMPPGKGNHENPKYIERRRQEFRTLTPKQRTDCDKLQVLFRGQKWDKADDLWETFKQSFIEAKKPIPVHAIIPMIGCFAKTGRTEQMISLFKLLRKQGVEEEELRPILTGYLKAAEKEQILDNYESLIIEDDEFPWLNASSPPPEPVVDSSETKQ